MVCGGIAIKGSKICGRQACRDARSKRGRGYGRPHRRASQRALEEALVCLYCGEPEKPDDPFERAHVLAKADGGTNDPDNYAAAHESCNRREGARKEKVA